MSYQDTKRGQFLRYEYLHSFVPTINTDECVLWLFAATPRGYGIVTTPERKREYVHRIAFKIAYGRWPEPCALHRCDTPRCFNPRHLFEGTDADNVADMLQKGRAKGGSMPGTSHPGVILTEEQVREIRAAYIPRKVTFEALGKQYGVSMHAIFDIVKRRSWTHI